MVKYSQEPDNIVKAAKAKGTHLRVHFKHCREIGQAIKGRTISKARTYLENVLAFKEAIPFTKYTGGIGRHAVAKQYKTPGDKCGWPQKATKSFLDLLRNVESNAESKGLELDNCVITDTNVNQAPKMRRRTYRAHGRINAYMSSPAHITLIAQEKNDEVVKEKEMNPVRLSKKQLAIKLGGH